MQSASWKFSDFNPRLSGDLFLYFQKATESLHIYSKINSYFQGIIHAALSHEFTHFVEELSAEKFRKFTDVLFDVLGKNDVDVNRLIEAKEAVLRNTEEYKGRSEKELRAIAYSEAVAEMMEPVLTDTDAISRISQKIKQQDRSLWGKIKDFIKGIVEKLKAAYRDMEPDSAIARLTRETVTNSEAVLDAFSEAAADAVLNYNLQKTASKGFNAENENMQYSFRGVNKNGIEVYETSDEVKSLTYAQRIERFLSVMENDYKGRTAKFVRNGHTYYALFEQADLNKNIYGDKRSDKKGWKAKINAGAEGNIFELVENAKYNGSKAEQGKNSAAHKGVEYWDYFVKNVQIDNTVFDLVANVRKKAGGEYVYSIQLKENKTKEASPPLDSQRALNGVTNASTQTVAQPNAEVKGNFLKSSRDTSEMTYAEILAEQNALRARQKQVEAKKNEAMNNPELLSAMDSYTEMFSELRNLLGKKHRGEASAADIERISEIKNSREETLKKITKIQDDLGLNGISAEEAELRSMENTLRKAADSAWAREGAQKENKAIEKSGLSAPEYFRRKALRAFKTTRNFNEAGYLLPDGKMLDFSGGERNHRYRDHREIGEIYEATQGANALNRFLNDGNIRIMAESPGVDISANREPTAEQYAAIRKFVMSHGTDKGKFFVDFSNSDGRNVGNYSYNGNVSPERVLNDIKYFYENGETRKQSEVAEFLYSSRTSSDSEYLNLAQNPEENREALSRMVEQAAREAGYDSPVLYHGTQNFGFTNFDLDKMDDKRSIFLTSNPDIAATYSGVDGSRNIGKASGTDVNTLSLQEVAQMMNQFPPESGMDYQYSVVESKAEISGQVDRGLNELNNLINTLKKQYGKDSKEYGRLEKLQNTLYLGTNDGLSTQLWMILKQTDLFKEHEDFVNGLEQNLRLLKKAPESGSFLVEKALGGYSIDVLSEADAKEELAQNMQRGNYALYARLGNTLTVEGEGQRWNNLKNWAKGMEVDENSTYVMEDDGKFFLLRKADDSVVENGVIEATEKARELSPDALQFLLIQKANTSLRILTEVATTTRDVAKWAKNAGYDSVIFKNIKDSGGQNNSVSMDTTADIYVIFNLNNAKSADAVTYDDNGNVIPLSQRFDMGKEDIRYSARNPQAQVDAENERLKSDVKRQIAEAVREYRRQQDVQSKAYRQMYERQLEEVKKSYQKQISIMESEYSADLAQIQDAFFQTVEAYEKGQFRNEHLEKVLKQAAETQRTQEKASEADNATWEKEFNRLLRAYETSGRDVQRLKQTVENQRARAKAKVEAARVTEQRGKLYRAVNEINRRLLNPTKTLYVPDSLAPAVTKFMQGLTEAMESPKNSWNVQGALETLQGQYQKLTQMNEGVFTQEYNQGILDLLDNAINAVGGTDFNKLSASQIEDVYSAVRSVLTAIRNENKMFAANLNKTYAEAAEAVRREESALPNRKPTTGAVQDKAEKFGWNQLKPVYAMMRLGSDTLLKQYNNLRAGEDKWQRTIAAARAYGLGIMAKYHYDQWNDSLMKLDTETGTVELSLEERMSLYAYARREQAFEHLTKGGFVLSDKNTRTVKNRFGIKTEQT